MSAKNSNIRFKEEVLNSAHLSLVQFKTEWNGTCEIIAPVFEDLKRSYKSSVQFFTIDTDKEKFMAGKFGISETPAILFFKNGKIVDHSIGLISKKDLIAKIESALTRKIN